MSVIDGVNCFECGSPRTADLTDGYEARSAGEQRGWLCQGCAARGEPGRRFVAAMRACHRGVAFFRVARPPWGHPRRIVVRAPWMIT